MKKDELESAILDLWLKSRIPLTRAHLQFHTGVGRKKLEAWLDELLIEGVLSVEVTDDGEMVYMVAGASRPANGATSFAELENIGSLNASVSSRRKSAGKDDALDDLQTALLSGQARGLAKKASQSLSTKEGEKSLLTSAALSLFLGPLGWFYAGSYKEAAVGSAAFLAAAMILPAIPLLNLFVLPLLLVGMPLSAVAGAVYAWQHNRKGERIRLLSGNDDDDSE